MRKLLSSIAACALILSACATQRAAQTEEPEATPSEAAATATATAPAEAKAESCPMPEGAEAAEAPATDSAGPVVAPGLAKVGDKTTCPVSKETFVVKADSPKAEYDGKTYYFCCPHCAEKFQANPAQFVPGA
jgi:YHS domain-containing protein